MQILVPKTDIQRIRTYLRYDEVSGKLFWIKTKSCRNVAGREAGHIARTGYIVVRFDGRLWQAHRLIWAIVHGEMPGMDIDHINGNRSDNRLSNLRLALKTQNNWNVGISRNNTSGIRGVNWDKRRERWRARIIVSGKLHHLGFFQDIERATAARKAAELQLHGDFARHV